MKVEAHLCDPNGLKHSNLAAVATVDAGNKTRWSIFELVCLTSQQPSALERHLLRNT